MATVEYALAWVSVPSTPPANYWTREWGEVASVIGNEIRDFAATGGRLVSSMPVAGEHGQTAGFFLVFEREMAS